MPNGRRFEPGSKGCGLDLLPRLEAAPGERMPRLSGRFGYRAVLLVGLAFLGLPAFFSPLAQGLGQILAVTLVRGVGFGAVTAVFAALVVELAPPERRG